MENNEVNVNEGNQSGISLRLLWDVLKRCWYWMLLGAVLMGGLSLWYFNRKFVQQYSSSSYFYISKNCHVEKTSSFNYKTNFNYNRYQSNSFYNMSSFDLTFQQPCMYGKRRI